MEVPPFLLSPHCLLPLLPSFLSPSSLSLSSPSPLYAFSPLFLSPPPPLPHLLHPLPPSLSTNGIYMYIHTLKELWTKVSSRSITTHFFLSVGAFGNSRCLGPVYCCVLDRNWEKRERKKLVHQQTKQVNSDTVFPGYTFTRRGIYI